MRIRIGELAKMTGCQAVTIRYYEKEGLLPAPDRDGGNYRLYADADVERLHFIRHCRHHGMKLSEIRELLAFKDKPEADCAWINRMIEGHIAEVGAQIASLTHLKGHLEALLKQCSGKGAGQCGILSSLHRADHCPYCEDARCRLDQSGDQPGDPAGNQPGDPPGDPAGNQPGDPPDDPPGDPPRRPARKKNDENLKKIGHPS